MPSSIGVGLCQHPLEGMWLNAPKQSTKFADTFEHKNWPLLISAQGHVAECFPSSQQGSLIPSSIEVGHRRHQLEGMWPNIL